jgi:hypothetical protein
MSSRRSLAVLNLLLPGLLWSSEVSIAGVLVAPPQRDLPTAFGQIPGSSLALRLSVPGGGAFASDTRRARLEHFRDDLGVNLLRPSTATFGPATPAVAVAAIADDGASVLVELWGAGLPSASASALVARGEVTVLSGGREETVRQEGVRLTVGQRFSAGPVTWTVSEVQESGIVEGAMDVELMTRDDDSVVCSLMILGPDGKDAALHQGRIANAPGSRLFVLPSIEPGWTLVAVVRLDAERKRLPFAVTAGLGTP